MGELKDYLELKQKVLNDSSLAALIREHDSDLDKLSTLLSVPNYNAAEAIELANDIDYLSSLIIQNPLYLEYLAAKESVVSSMQKRASHISGCRCAVCKARELSSSRKAFEEDQ